MGSLVPRSQHGFSNGVGRRLDEYTEGTNPGELPFIITISASCVLLGVGVWGRHYRYTRWKKTLSGLAEMWSTENY
jgi:hypothetical protein